MKMFLYYALHSVKNQIKRLLKPWFLIFIGVCFLLGALIGIGVVVLEEATGGFSDDTNIEEDIGNIEDDMEEEPVEELTEEDLQFILEIVELIVGAIILLSLLYSFISGDKNGSNIFTMPDVNFLFASPMRPQSVLLFRLMMQIGGSLFLYVYLLCTQLPNLVINLELGIFPVVMILLAVVLLLLYGKLLNIFVYVAASTHEKLKKYVRPVGYGFVFAIAGIFFLWWKGSGLDIWEAVCSFFNGTMTRFIPVWGWMKGIVMFAIEGNVVATIGVLVVSILGMVLFTWAIWHMKADFYEDALQKSAEMAEVMQAAQEGQMVINTKKKDRSERFTQKEFHYGAGANVFLYKSLFNRFRFAHFRIFTKTAETYFVVALVTSLIIRFLVDFPSITIVALVLCVMVFYRSMGNPLAEDLERSFFFMIPENPWIKVFYSMIGGTINCLLDLVPGFIAATIVLQVNPFVAFAWLLFVATADFYSSTVGMFIDLAIPDDMGRGIKVILQVVFLYFGIVPDVILLIAGLVLNMVPLFVAICVAFNIAVGMVFFALSPLFLLNGRK